MTGARGVQHSLLLRQRIAAGLRAQLPTVDDPGDLRVAAVALVILPGADGSAELPVVRRAVGLRAHADQYALPGGSLETGEDASDGARRELAEELGLELPAAAVIGHLKALATRSGYLIHPVVLWAETPVTLEPDGVEVARIHRLPLAEFDLAVDQVTDSGSLPVLGTRIYAPTAEILRRFREVALHGRDPGPGWDAPPFAWR